MVGAGEQDTDDGGLQAEGSWLASRVQSVGNSFGDGSAKVGRLAGSGAGADKFQSLVRHHHQEIR